MSTGWEGYEPAPLEFFHGRLMDAFHELRNKFGDNEQKTITMNGIDMNNLIAKCKIETYKKYPKQISNKAIPKKDI